MAQAELHVRGFFSHPPLVGAAGRIGQLFVPYGQGSHPGPALWVALLPAYLITGRASFGLMLGMATMQFAFISGAVYLARRVGGDLAGLLAAIAALVIVRSGGPRVILDPWNPWGSVFAFFCMIPAIWGAVNRRPRCLPIAYFCGVFAVQCHVGYLPIVAAALGLTTIVVLIQQRPTHDRSPLERRAAFKWIGWSVVGALVMWIPPVLDQIRRNPGNLRILWHHFTATVEPDGTPRIYVGLATAVKVACTQLGVIGPWLVGDRISTIAIHWLYLAPTIVLLALALRRLRSARHEPGGRLAIGLAAICAGLGVVGIAATARIFGGLYEYTVRWWWVIAAWLFVAALLVPVADVRGRATTRCIGLGVVAVVGVFAIADFATTSAASPRNSRLVAGVTHALAGRLPRGGHHLVRWHDPATLSGVPYGVLLELERSGYSVGVDPQESAGALPHRVLPEANATDELFVVLGETPIAEVRIRADSKEIAYYDDRSAAERTESTRLRSEIEQKLAAIHLECLAPNMDTQYGIAYLLYGPDPTGNEIRGLVARYDAIGVPVALFLMPVRAPLYQPTHMPTC